MKKILKRTFVVLVGLSFALMPILAIIEASNSVMECIVAISSVTIFIALVVIAYVWFAEWIVEAEQKKGSERDE